MAKNINDTYFNDSTKLKLDIFRDCFKEWLPVFIHDPWTEKIVIYDFFAGSGYDKNLSPGSPIILLDEAKGENRKFCSKVRKNVSFIFNEYISEKMEELSKNVEVHISNCEDNNNCGGCIYEAKVNQSEFKSLFTNPTTKNVLSDKTIAKFILLDQYGFKQIDEDIFNKLISYPKTDFIFFITSSFIKRFKTHPSVKLYIDTEKINFDETKPKDCHRIIAEYFRKLVPKNKDYFLHHFSIRKEKSGNYYGLILGSNHTLGMEKFLKVCWQKDSFSGESNFNIDNDFEVGTLFHSPENSNKIEKMKFIIEQEILSKKICDNIFGLEFTLKLGCEPKLFTNIVKDLEKRGKITRTGNLNYASTNIHKIKKYNIHLLN